MSEQKPFEPTVNPMTATVQEMFGQVLQQRIQSGALEQAIAKHVDDLINEAARDCLRSHGDVGRALKEQFTKAIMPQLDSIKDLPTYHEYVTNRLKLAAQNFYDTQMAAALDKEMKDLLTELPDQVTLSWLVAQVANESKSDDGGDSYEGQTTLIIEHDIKIYGEFAHVYLDKGEDRLPHDCEYDLHLSKDKETGKWDIIDLRMNHRKAGEQLSFGRTYGFDKVLFNIYAMKGQIDLDCGTDASDYDTGWCNG